MIVLVAEIRPLVNKLPDVVLPVALKVVAEITLAPVILPLVPVDIILPPVMFPVAEINPPVKMLPDVVLPVTDVDVPVIIPPTVEAAVIVPVVLIVPVVAIAFVVLLKVNPADPPNTPLLLYCICVLAPPGVPPPPPPVNAVPLA